MDVFCILNFHREFRSWKTSFVGRTWLLQSWKRTWLFLNRRYQKENTNMAHQILVFYKLDSHLLCVFFNLRLFNWRGFEGPLRAHRSRKCSRSLTWRITFFTTWKVVRVPHLQTQIAPIQKAHNLPPQESRITLFIISKTKSLVWQEHPWNQVLKRDLQLQILAQSLKWQQPLLKKYHWTIENKKLRRQRHRPGKEGER